MTNPCPDAPNQSQTISRRKILISTSRPRTLRTTGRTLQPARQVCLGDTETRARAVHVQAVLNTAPRGAVGAAVAPELTEFLAQFLAGHVPVVADAFTEFDDVAFDF